MYRAGAKVVSWSTHLLLYKYVDSKIIHKSPKDQISLKHTVCYSKVSWDENLKTFYIIQHVQSLKTGAKVLGIKM